MRSVRGWRVARRGLGRQARHHRLADLVVPRVLFLADRMEAVCSARALSIAAVCYGFLSWAAFHLSRVANG